LKNIHISLQSSYLTPYYVKKVLYHDPHLLL
jgi:hypothetical protein